MTQGSGGFLTRARAGLATTTLLAMAGLMAACGGGGGGGGDAGSSGSALRVSFDTTSLSLEVQEGSAAGTGAQVIRASASGGGSTDPVYIGAEVSGQGVSTPIDVVIDTTTRTATITVSPDAALAEGSYSGSLRLLACRDPLCNTQVSGSPHTVSLRTAVLPRLKASATQVDFIAAETTAPAAQTLQVVLPRGASAPVATVAYGAGGSGWLDVQTSGLAVVLQPRAQAAEGNLQATVEITATGTAERVMVPVSYSVSAGLVVTPAVSTRITSDSPASAAAGEVAVALAPGISASGWTASTSSPWLRLQSASGAPGTPLRWSIDAAAFAQLANQATHTATVQVSAGDALTPRTVVVSLAKDVAEVEALDALAVLAGEAGEVLLAGRGFGQLTAPAARLASSGFTPTAVTVRSGQLLALQVPALAAGSYPISLNTSAGLATRTVQLRVLAAEERGHQYIAIDGRKGALVWDAVSQSAHVRNLAQGSVIRVQLLGTAAQPDHALSSRSITGLAGIGLTPSRDALVAVTDGGSVLQLSTSDLSTLASHDTGSTVQDLASALPLAISGDNLLWLRTLAGLQVQDLTRRTALGAPASGQSPAGGLWARVSANGQRLLMAQTASTTGPTPLLARDTTDGLLSAVAAAAPTSFSRASSNRAGTRWVLDGAVYGFDLTPQGRLTPPAGWTGTESAMSRDGTRAYLFTRNTFNTESRIWVFDSAQTASSSSDLPVLGFFEPFLNPSCSNQLQDERCDALGTRMVLTDDDRTVIAVGDRYLAVVPVPTNLRGGTPPATTLRAPHRLSGR